MTGKLQIFKTSKKQESDKLQILKTLKKQESDKLQISKTFNKKEVRKFRIRDKLTLVMNHVKSECTKKMKNMRCDLLAVRDSISFPYYLSKVTISVY